MLMSSSLRSFILALLGTLLLLLDGCATAPKPAVVAGVTDPYESWNRKVFDFNDALDRAIFSPLASGYKTVVPEPIRNCITNIFGNVSDVYTALNNVLQGKFKTAGADLCRVAINSTIGLLGCFDVATQLGFEKHNEDFGQTLAVWGVGAGPYMVLPFYGPTTLRDSSNLVVDWVTYPVNQVTPIYVRNSIRALRLIDTRAQLLTASTLADAVAIDKYQFYRDAYLQRRRYLIFDGDPPEEALPKYEDESESLQPSSPDTTSVSSAPPVLDQVVTADSATVSQPTINPEMDSGATGRAVH